MADGTKIKLSGILCGEDGKGKLTEILDGAWNSGAEDLAVDLSGVEEMDFEALTALLSTRNKFSGAGGRMTLYGIPARIARLAEILRIQLEDGK